MVPGGLLRRHSVQMTETLAEKKCTPCRGGVPPLTQAEAERFKAQTPNWDIPMTATVLKEPSASTIYNRRFRFAIYCTSAITSRIVQADF